MLSECVLLIYYVYQLLLEKYKIKVISNVIVVLFITGMYVIYMYNFPPCLL